MATRRKQHKRSPHPGVVLSERTLPSGRKAWRARFRDPDNPKHHTWQTLDPATYPTRDARKQWAMRKSQALAARRRELDAGAPQRTRTTLTDALDDYLEMRARQVRPDTLVADKQACARFRAWVVANGPGSVEELTPARLLAYRESRIAAPKLSQARGKRGARRVTKDRRSPATINHELRPILALANHWRRMDLLPGVTRDQLGEALQPLRQPANRPAHLSPPQPRQLLEAALRHDEDTFKLTAAEHRGDGVPGQTRRYHPITPFVAFMLLTGCRIGEALNLRWDDVDLEALDYDGSKVGEIRLKADATKTWKHRAVGLEVSPQLRRLLTVMKLQSGGTPFVFGGHAAKPRTQVEAARKRLVAKYGAPAFTWQNLRQTVGTFLTNAPGIFGAAAAWRSAQHLGHSVTVAERHYVGLVRGIPREVHTLDAALQVEEIMERVVEETSNVSEPRRSSVALARGVR